MEINITGRHLELTEAIKKHIMEKIEKFNKYLKNIIDIHIILSIENDIRHVAEIILKAKENQFFAKEETTDMYSSIDKAVDTIEKQLRHHKEKLKNHHLKHAETQTVEENNPNAQTKKTSVIVNSKSLGKPMGPEEATMELEAQNLTFFVFKDVIDNNKIKVIYKRNDGNYGLIEPL